MAYPNTVYGAGAKEAILKKNPDDVVIVAATRTALTKVRKGSLSFPRVIAQQVTDTHVFVI